MAEVKLLVPKLLKWEGGFVNDPLDLGGATNKGITIGTFKAFRKNKGLPEPTVEDLKNLTETEWAEILKKNYWDKWHADEIKNQSIADLLVDWLWMSGVYGIKLPQKILGVTIDGIVGPKTIDAVNSYADQRELFEKLKQERLDYYNRICTTRPANNRFKKGWINRLNDYTFEP